MEGRLERLAAAATYLLPAPAKKLAVRRAGDLAWFHYRQALALSFLLACIAIAIAPAMVLSAFLFVRWEDGFARFRPDAVLDALFRAAGVGWALLWLAGVLRALAASRRPLPLTRRIAGSKALGKTALAVSSALWLLFAGAAAATAHSLHLARRAHDRFPSVYILYDAELAQRWVFALATYRLALAADARWGRGATAVAPLTEESLREATSEGRLVYLGTHGEGGRILVRGKLLGPADMRAWIAPGEKLQFVYLAACHAGSAAGEWARAFAPARVVTFDRNSAVLEHAAWFWF
ncbi:MAG: hypothetical protein ACUVYA_19410, partial [Planctomycetota bacterium]